MSDLTDELHDEVVRDCGCPVDREHVCNDLRAAVEGLRVRANVRHETPWQEGFRQSRNETVAAVLAIIDAHHCASVATRGPLPTYGELMESPVGDHDHSAECDCLPIRVVVDQHGHYWRDYGDHWSMCPVSSENVSTEPVSEFYPLDTPEGSVLVVTEAGLAGVRANWPDHFDAGMAKGWIAACDRIEGVIYEGTEERPEGSVLVDTCARSRG